MFFSSKPQMQNTCFYCALALLFVLSDSSFTSGAEGARLTLAHAHTHRNHGHGEHHSSIKVVLEVLSGLAAIIVPIVVAMIGYFDSSEPQSVDVQVINMDDGGADFTEGGMTSGSDLNFNDWSDSAGSSMDTDAADHMNQAFDLDGDGEADVIFIGDTTKIKGSYNV